MRKMSERVAAHMFIGKPCGGELELDAASEHFGVVIFEVEVSRDRWHLDSERAPSCDFLCQLKRVDLGIVAPETRE